MYYSILVDFTELCSLISINCFRQIKSWGSSRSNINSSHGWDEYWICLPITANRMLSLYYALLKRNIIKQYYWLKTMSQTAIAIDWTERICTNSFVISHKNSLTILLFEVYLLIVQDEFGHAWNNKTVAVDHWMIFRARMLQADDQYPPLYQVLYVCSQCPNLSVNRHVTKAPMFIWDNFLYSLFFLLVRDERLPLCTVFK